MKKIVLASGNPGKLAEFRELLADTGLTLIAQSSLGIAEAEETGLSFIENALIKARQACRLSGLPALADDSGLIVPALAGAPGLISAHYAGADGNSQANRDHLLKAMQALPAAQRSAHFYCVLVLMRHASDAQPLIASGSWYGRILSAPRGSAGFGYDPIFFDPAQGKSAAEMSNADKNRISHRGQAMRQLRGLLIAAAEHGGTDPT